MEDRYEHIDLIVKVRADGVSWFDCLHDYITQDCDSVRIDPDDEDSDWTPCSCGMESMGGMTGTLQACYDHQTNLGQGLQPIDVARAIISLVEHTYNSLGTDEEQKAAENVIRVITWAHKEIEFEAYFENREWENEEDATT